MEPLISPAGGPLPLVGRTVGITADRRWEEQADLLRRRGAAVLHGPTLRTVDLSHDDALRQVTMQLAGRAPDYLVVTTGMGLRMWLEAAGGWGQEAPLKESLAKARIVARGAKAASAVKGAGLPLWWRAPHETMEEIVEHLAGEPLGRSRLALQLFDPGGHPSTDALREAAGDLVEVPVYRWQMPDDARPAIRLIEATVGGELDAVTFTSQPAVRHLFRIAESLGPSGPSERESQGPSGPSEREAQGAADDLRAAVNGPVLPACIGPVCAEAAREEGIKRPVWPEPPRLPAMVRQMVEQLETRAVREIT